MRVTPYVRLLPAVVLFAISLLAVLPAPTNLLWMVAIAVTEWGHLLALACLLAALLLRGRSRAGRIALGLCLTAAALSLSPLLRAIPVAHSLPRACASAFGDEGRPRTSPLTLGRLVQLRRPPAISAQPVVYRTVEGERLSLDFYPAASNGRSPLVLCIHGGSWRGGDNKAFIPMDRALAGRGYAVADVNYRLAPRWPYPAASDDVRAALQFLRAHADSLALDPARIVLLGRSAGGQIALDVAYHDADPGLRGVIAFYAPTDLRWSWEHPVNPRVLDIRGALRDFLGGGPEAEPARYVAASSVQAVRRELPPTLLLHGGRDELVSARHSQELDRLLATAGVPHLTLLLPWATHGFDYLSGSPGEQLSTYAVEWLLGATTRD